MTILGIFAILGLLGFGGFYLYNKKQQDMGAATQSAETSSASALAEDRMAKADSQKETTAQVIDMFKDGSV